MKKLGIAIILLLAGTSYAGQKAITDTGEEVILNSDGTWQYIDEAKKAAEAIVTNEKEFKKPADSKFLLKSTKNNAAFWLNTDKWAFKRGKDTDAAEYEFRLKRKDVFAQAINEEVRIPVEAMENIVLMNAQQAAPDSKIVQREFRTVNGNKVLFIELSGSMHGLSFTYLAYCYSDTSGTTQLVAYTGTGLLDKYKSEMIDFLNGLVAQ